LERRTLGEECLVGKYTTKQTIKHLVQLVRINCGLPDRKGNTQKSNGRRCSNSTTTSACAVALNIAGEILSVKSTSCLSARAALMALTIFSLFAGSATPPRGSTLSISCSSFGFACGPRSEFRVRVRGLLCQAGRRTLVSPGYGSGLQHFSLLKILPSQKRSTHEPWFYLWCILCRDSATNPKHLNGSPRGGESHA